MPATLWSCLTKSSAFVGVSTSSAITNLSFAGKYFSPFQIHPQIPQITFCVICGWLLFNRAAADGRIQSRNTFASQNLRESFVNLLRNVRSLVDKASVQLHETGARRDLFPCVLCVEDSTDAD